MRLEGLIISVVSAVLLGRLKDPKTLTEPKPTTELRPTNRPTIVCADLCDIGI